jgi:hypothetical protein
MEWAVWPPGMIDTAILDVAVATAMRPSEWTVAIKHLYKKILPMPPGLSTNKTEKPSGRYHGWIVMSLWHVMVWIRI